MARPLILSLDVQTKSAQQSLDSFRKKMRSSFTSNDTKSLEQNIKNTTKEINKLEGQIEKTKQKLRELGQSDTKPKSVVAMEKELATLEKQLQKTDAEFEKLNKEQEDLAARQVPGLTLEQSLSPEQYARFQELDNLVIKNGEDTEQLTNRINELKAKLAEVKGNPELTAEGKRYNQELDEATKELDNQRQKLQELQGEMSNTTNNTKELPQSFNALTKPLKRIQGLIKRVFFFSLITKALRGLRTALGNIISQNSALRSSLAQIKGNLLTAFAPIWTAVLPVIQTLFNWLVKVTVALAQFISLISGKSVKASIAAAKALYKQATATKDVGSAAKGASDEVEKSLLDFDELNTISTPKNDGDSSEGGDTSGTSAPDFSSMLDESQQLSDFWSSLALTIKDVFFEWGQDLTAENIAEKIITAAGLVTGAVIGWTLGGPKGALIGATIGTGLSLLLSSVIFNHDGSLSSGEIINSIVSILGAIAGGVVGFSVGGPVGTAIGIVIGAGLSLAIMKTEFNFGEKLTQVQILKLIVGALGAIAGGILGFVAGGPAGAAVGIIAGAYFGFKIGSVTGDMNGNITSESLAQLFFKLILPLAGGIIGFFVGGPAGALLGIGLGCILNLSIEQMLPEGFKEGAVKWFANLSDTLSNFFTKWVINPIKKLLGIHSPSTVFAEMGENTMKGYDNGIKDHKSSVLTTFTNLYNDIKDTFKNAPTWFKNKFEDAFTKTKNAFNGWKDWFSDRKDEIASDTKSVFKTVDTWFGGKFGDTWTTIKDRLSTWKSWFTEKKDELTSSEGIFNDTDTWFGNKFGDAWKAIKDIFSGTGEGSWDGFWTGLWNSIKTKFSQLGTNLSSAIGDSIRSGLNSVISWVEKTINKAINLINGAIDLINLIPGVSVGHVNSITLPRIPPLAQGAVLPPNQPFLAMVGDQKHGTNIEAPLSTIEEAVENVLNKRGYTDNQTININFTGNLSQLARVLNPVIEKEKNRGSTKLVKGGAY